MTTPRVGDRFDAAPFRLSLQRLVMCSAASRDFAPAHLSPDAARRDGAPDAYADISFAFAMVERLLLAWLGPAIWVRSLGPLKIRDFVLADRLVLAGGEVLAASTGAVAGRPSDELTIQIEIRQSDGRVPITGSARVAVPMSSNEEDRW